MLKKIIKKYIFLFFETIYPNLKMIRKGEIGKNNFSENLILGKYVKITPSFCLSGVDIGDYTYIAENSVVSLTEIGKFCSIGPKLMCGYGIHPINGISTHPMFYSTLKQNGMTLSETDKVIERKKIIIGNDVFIGANVTILDGVRIGDGAVIGAGSVVSKDIPPYAVAVGAPIKVIKYRFDEFTIKKMLEIKWWNNDEFELENVEKNFFNIKKFMEINRIKRL